MKRLILKIFIFLLNIVYAFFKLLKSRKKVVMISRQSNNVNNDFRLLGDVLKSKYGLEVVYLCRTLDGGVNSTLLTKIYYGLHMFTQMYHLATSSVCVLDSYSPVVSILNHKKSLKIVQMWHSIGKMKKFGFQIINLKEGSSSMIAETMNMHKNYDVIYCAGEAYKDVLMEGFNADESKVRIFTLPRVDLLNDEKYISETRKAIYEEYPQLKDKSKLNVVYAPTFRKDESGFDTNFQKLVKCFDFDKYNLIVKLHALSELSVRDERVIFDEKFSTLQMLSCTDKLISDYSCMIYEAGIKKIPIYFYNYDMELYEENRGLVVDYDALPGYKSPDPAELVASLEKPYDIEYLDSFVKSVIDNTENCSEKMADDIASML